MLLPSINGGIFCMGIPLEENVLKVLKYIERDLYDIVTGAWQDWLKCSEFGRTRFSRTRANIVWERMIDRAYQVFSGDKRIDFIERNNTVFFVVDNRILFRFKKGDFSGLSHNYPTQTAIDFNDHDILLFDDVDLSRVEIGYVLDKSEIQIETVSIVARNDLKVLWSHEILPQGIVIEAPIPSATKTPTEPLVEAVNKAANEEKAQK
jgi:hypothetical protein